MVKTIAEQIIEDAREVMNKIKNIIRDEVVYGDTESIYVEIRKEVERK